MNSPLTDRNCRAEMRPGSGIFCGRHKGHDTEAKGEDWHRQRGADGGNTWRVARDTAPIPGRENRGGLTMTRTDKLAFKKFAYYEDGEVYPFASFDVTSDSDKDDGK